MERNKKLPVTDYIMFSLYIFYYVLHVLHVRNLNCVLYFIHMFVNIHAHYTMHAHTMNLTPLHVTSTMY